MSTRVIPYDTGKVKIGCAYVPPRKVVDIGVHAEMLQSALLGIKAPWYARMVSKLFNHAKTQ